MAVGSAQVTVGTTAVLLARVPDVSGPGPQASVLISNGSGATVYLGGAGVTSSNGSAVAVSTAVTLWLFPGDALYGITASSTSTVGVLQT